MSLRPKKKSTPLKRKLSAIEESRKKKRMALRNQIVELQRQERQLREDGEDDKASGIRRDLMFLRGEQTSARKEIQDEIDRTTWSKKTLRKHGISGVRMTEDPPFLIIKFRGAYESPDTHQILNAIRWLSVTMGITTHNSFTDWENRYIKYNGDKITITLDTTNAIMRELEIDEEMFHSFS